MNRLAVYPGSFDPLTNGHLDIIKRSLALFEKVIIAVANNSTKQSLFSIEERIELIRESVKDFPNVIIDTFDGLLVDYCREKNSRVIIRGLRAVTDFDYEYAISLMNKELAPEIETVFLMASSENSFISSSIVKEVTMNGRELTNKVPHQVNQALLKKFNKKGNK